MNFLPQLSNNSVIFISLFEVLIFQRVNKPRCLTWTLKKTYFFSEWLGSARTHNVSPKLRQFWEFRLQDFCISVFVVAFLSWSEAQLSCDVIRPCTNQSLATFEPHRHEIVEVFYFNPNFDFDCCLFRNEYLMLENLFLFTKKHLKPRFQGFQYFFDTNQNV